MELLNNLVLTQPQKNVFRNLDRIMFVCFCATAYFLPIASAITESLFGVIFVTFLIKRSLVYAIKRKEYPHASFKQRIKLFFGSFRPLKTGYNRYLVIFLAFALIGILASHYPGEGVKGLTCKLLQDLLTFWIFLEVVNSRKRLSIFLAVFLTSVTLVSVDGVTQYFTRMDFIRGNPINDGRITASFKHANDLSGYLVMILPVLLCLSALLNIRKLKEKLIPVNRLEKFFFSRAFKFLVMIVFILALFCLGGAFSRAGWLAFIISLIFIGIQRPKFLAGFLIIFALFFAFFYPRIMTERTVNVSDGGFFATSDRLVYWSSALTIIEDRPLVGVGLNAYSRAAKEYDIPWKGYPHNCYLHMAAEVGVPGFLSFLFFLFMIFRRGFQNLRKFSPFSFFFNLYFGLLAGFFAFLVQSFFDPSFYAVQLETLMWLMLALIVAIPRITFHESPSALEN